MNLLVTYQAVIEGFERRSDCRTSRPIHSLGDTFSQPGQAMANRRPGNLTLVSPSKSFELSKHFRHVKTDVGQDIAAVAQLAFNGSARDNTVPLEVTELLDDDFGGHAGESTL